MITLAIHEDSNSNATLLKEDKILHAVNEDGFTRKKFQGGFPFKSVEYILKNENMEIGQIDNIVCGNQFHFASRILNPKFTSEEHDFFGFSQKAMLLYQEHVRLKKRYTQNIYTLNKILETVRFKKKCIFIDHHTAHAYSAAMTSGISDGLVVTIDNYGDGYSSKLFSLKNNSMKFLYGTSALNSPGQFYGEIAQLLGVHCLMAGKITGLASFGDHRKLYSRMVPLFSLSPNKKDFTLPSLKDKFRKSVLYRDLLKFKPADVAAAAQKRLEDVITDYVGNALKMTGHKNLMLAGGVFGNVALNKKLKELMGVEQIYIHPAMSDMGISLGAAFAFLSKEGSLRPFSYKNVYFGPGFNEDHIQKVLEDNKLKYTYFKSGIEGKIAKLLSLGKVVARFTGRMEYGPRALGNRSILYQTTDPSINDWLNKKLRRTEYMPFAPATLLGYEKKCYKNITGSEYTAQFMTITFDCTDYMKKVSPGVIHIDGTARPQIVTENFNSSFYNIINEYRKLTGIPSLINTSFNMHGEPIVQSPEDAARSFKASGLEFMAIENFLVSVKN